jgi:hypothetical protein
MHNALQYAIDERNKAMQIAQNAIKQIALIEEQHKQIKQNITAKEHHTVQFAEMHLQQKIDVVNAYNVAIETATIAHDAEKIAERIADKIAITERDEYYRLYEEAEKLKELYEEAQEKVDIQIAKYQKAGKTTMDIIRSRHETHEMLRQAEHNIKFAQSWLDGAKEIIKERFGK